MKPERAYLQHILRCIGRITEDCAGGREALFASPTVQDAVLRNLQVLCESTQRLSASNKARHPEVDWRAISGLRNVLVHDYFDTDLDTIWRIVQRDLPILEKAVGDMLSEQEGL